MHSCIYGQPIHTFIAQEVVEAHNIFGLSRRGKELGVLVIVINRRLSHHSTMPYYEDVGL